MLVNMCVLVTVLLLLAQGTWCQPDGYLYFADYVLGALYKMDLSLGQNAQRINIVARNLPDPLLLDVNPYTEDIYVANIYTGRFNTTQFIKKYHFNSGNTAIFPLSHSAEVSGLVVDPISQLIYYTDWAHEVITVVSTDFRYHAVIIEGGLDIPAGIALDPVNKVIFWTDRTKATPYIAKANMDGTNKENIVHHGINSPGPVVFDPYDGKIYWADYTSYTIERCNPDGTRRELFLTLTSVTWDLDVDETYVYFVQRRKGTIYRVRKLGTQTLESAGQRFPDNSTDYRTLAYVKKSPPPKGANQCSGSSRGGCDHLCIPTVQSRVCRCSVGYILQPDGTSCEKSPFVRGIVAADVNRRALIVLDLDTNITKTITDRWHDNPTGVIVDEDTSEVFWVDVGHKAISKACISTSCYYQLKVFYEEDSNLAALTIDSPNQKLYVVDAGLERIFRISYSGSQEEILLRGVTGFTNVITLDIKNRMMYWANDEMIERSSMDGIGRGTFLRTAVQLSGLVFDSYGSRLFALHYQIAQVVEYSVNGATERVVYRPDDTSSHTYYGLALSNGNLYFSDREQQLIYEMNIKTKVFKEFGRPRFQRVVGMAYFGPGERTSEEPTNAPTNPSTTTASTVQTGGEQEQDSAAPSGGQGLNQTLIIAISVSLGGILIIILIIICGVVVYKRMMISVGAPPISSVAPQVLPLQAAASKPKDSVYDELMYEKPYVAKMGSPPASPPAPPVAAQSTQPPPGMMRRVETRPLRPLPTHNRPPVSPPVSPPVTRDLSYIDMRGGSGDHSEGVPLSTITS